MKMIKLLLTTLLVLSISGVWAATRKLEKVPDRPVAQDMEFPDLSGKMHKISDFRGKVVIVNYFASWCGPCREEMPSLNKAWQKVKDGDVQMIAIAGKENVETVQQFVKDVPVEFTVLVDEQGEIFNNWPIIGIPTTLVLDKEGRITYRTVGKQNWDDNTMLRPVYMLEHGKLD